MTKIKITDTSLRDGHQSLWATRMTTDDMSPVLDKLDNIGYHSLEVWGGATFDVSIRYLNEDPWERLRFIRQRVKKTKLQMLLRGQNLVGYAHYADDVVEKFVYKAAENGIDIFRVFDALNDIRNLETCMRAVKKTGQHVQACLVYTTSPVHSMKHFVQMALNLKDMGADSICIKDMAGLLSPYVSFELVTLLKEKVGLPIQLHTHYIGGLAVVSCIKAAEAGVDIIDTASVTMAFGSSQPPVETIVRALQGSPWDTGLNLHDLFQIADYFEQIRKHKGFERGVTKISDMKVFEHQVPGGMISNFVSQLEEQKASNRLDEVLEEIPKVRKDLGYPPLVTPTSQIVGTQAVLNVLMGERYKLCPGEVKDYVRGLYGKPPAVIDKSIIEKIIGNDEVITGRPADLIQPAWEKGKQEMADISDNEEDILTYLLFPQVALKFFEYRRLRANEDIPQILSVDEVSRDIIENKEDIVIKPISKVRKKPSVRGDEEMNLDELRELILLFDQTSIAELEVQKDDYRICLRKSSGNNDNPASHVSSPVSAPKLIPPQVADEAINDRIVAVHAPMVGTFYNASSPDAKPFVQIGDHVSKGQTLCILEAMKLMNEIKAEFDGTIVDTAVENAEAIEYDQVLFLIEKD
ncbi:MAG: acetyl-CoA carboxylase biotin carboxyl carrier protein [Firmicutes bacterium HGW-Firmicutes-15]|nr:MAG: acetyl-CoA carboxylase biotin carboxyl carrier protein [Firmicutes bacterium HGW-Firmicutes-15]